jgi:quinol monooxygenase YgiN
MAIMLSVETQGVGQEKYDAVMKEMGLTKKGAKWPKGILSHTAGAIPGGWLVVDVWESEAAAGKFQQTMLQPAFQKVGGMPEPRMTIAKVHYSYPAKKK